MVNYSKELYRKRLSLELAITRGAPRRVGFRPLEDTAKLLQIPADQEFVETAYLRILGRDADDAGLAGYLDALRNKTSRREVIKRLAASDEAKRWAGVDSDEHNESAKKPPMMQRLREGVVGKARHLLNQLLLSRFDAIDFRLAFLLNNMAERDQTLSTKLDEALKGIHEKLDSRAGGPGGAVSRDDGPTRLWKSLVKPGTVAADVGANTGHFTLAAATAGKVHSFEPDPHISHPVGANIHFHAEAASDAVGTATLTVFPAQNAYNTLFWSSTGPSKIPVRTTTLDAALVAEPRVDLVVIDVEGAEALVLRGMKRVIENNPQIRILVAFSPANLQRAEVGAADFLKEIHAAGFRITRVDAITGELHATTDAELVTVFSAFLHLGMSA